MSVMWCCYDLCYLNCLNARDTSVLPGGLLVLAEAALEPVAAVQPIRIPLELEALDSRQSPHWIYIVNMYHHKIITNPLSESLCFSLFFHPVFNQSSPSLGSPHLFHFPLQPEDSQSLMFNASIPLWFGHC